MFYFLSGVIYFIVCSHNPSHRTDISILFVAEENLLVSLLFLPKFRFSSTCWEHHFTKL